MNYNPKSFSYGYEAEWGDINRNRVLPSHLGKWDYSETDVINIYEPYVNVACDPLGLSPNMGGEINTHPTSSYIKQVQKIMELRDWFIDEGDQPSVCTTAHSHVHIHVPNLTQDIDALKRLIAYIQRNQETTVKYVYKFKYTPELKKYKNATIYHKFDGGRLMPNYICENILTKANNFNDFIKLHAAGKDGVSMGRPFRYAINTYSLKHISTVEFRCFRATIDEKQTHDIFKFVEKFIDAALNDGPSVYEILFGQNYDYDFPPMIWDANQYAGYLSTKYDQSRGKKNREFITL